jgi:hypothetical protein
MQSDPGLDRLYRSVAFFAFASTCIIYLAIITVGWNEIFQKSAEMDHKFAIPLGFLVAIFGVIFASVISVAQIRQKLYGESDSFFPLVPKLWAHFIILLSLSALGTFNAWTTVSLEQGAVEDSVTSAQNALKVLEEEFKKVTFEDSAEDRLVRDFVNAAEADRNTGLELVSNKKTEA